MAITIYEKFKENVAEANKQINGKMTGIIVSNSSGHGVPVGTKVDINNYRIQGGYTGTMAYQVTIMKRYDTNMNVGAWAYANEIKIYSSSIEDLEEENVSITKKIEELTKEINDNTLKVEFMKLNNITEFDETDFKVYKTLDLLENNTISKLEKAKLIADLVKGQ